MSNFWESNVWKIFMGIFILVTSLILADLLKKKIKFIRDTLLPTSVIAGLILLVLKAVWPWFNGLINVDFMSILTYHMLALGFIATSLKGNSGKNKTDSGVVLSTGCVTVSGYIIQAIVGLAVTIPLGLLLMDNLLPASGLILPMGFGQGTGQALNWGNIYETQYGFTGGATFGLSIAALGFIVACVVGVIYLNILSKKGKIIKNHVEKSEDEVVSFANEEPQSEAIDRLTIQFCLVLFVYFITYLVMAGISFLSDNYLGNFGVNTLKPLVWGFNFLFGTIFAVLAKKILGLLETKKFLKYKVTNDYILKRLSGLFFDIMIVAGVAAIDVTQLSNLWIPVLIMGAIGTIVTLIYLCIVSKHLWKGYEYQGIMSMFGMLTGTASTGMILLREIDGDFKTPAADNLVYQQVPAIAFGFPVLLLLSFAPESLTNTLITLGILVLMFVVYQIIIFRNKIFKRTKNN